MIINHDCNGKLAQWYHELCASKTVSCHRNSAFANWWHLNTAFFFLAKDLASVPWGQYLFMCRMFCKMFMSQVPAIKPFLQQNVNWYDSISSRNNCYTDTLGCIMWYIVRIHWLTVWWILMVKNYWKLLYTIEESSVVLWFMTLFEIVSSNISNSQSLFSNYTFETIGVHCKHLQFNQQWHAKQMKSI